MNEFLCKMLSISIGTLKDWGNGFEMVIARECIIWQNSMMGMCGFSFENSNVKNPKNHMTFSFEAVLVTVNRGICFWPLM